MDVEQGNLTQSKQKMTLVKKLENYLNEQEISQPRTPEEYIHWFEEKLEITRDLKEELREQMLLRRGKMSEYFYNELFPLWRLLQNKCGDWEQEKFAPVMGSQNYDIEVRTDRKDVPKYIEIINIDMNAEEYSINRQLFENRYAHVKSVSRESIKKRIKEAIDKKMHVAARPDDTALLVYFNDYTAFRYDNDGARHEMTIFADSINIAWQDRYITLYIVGASGKSFYERRRSREV